MSLLIIPEKSHQMGLLRDDPMHLKRLFSGRALECTDIGHSSDPLAFQKDADLGGLLIL